MQLDALSSLPIFHNSLLDWSIACGIALLLLLVLVLLRRFVRRWHAKFLKTEEIEWMEIPLEILSRTTLLFFFAIALYAGLRTLTMGAGTVRVLTSIMTIAAFLQSGVWVTAAVSAWLDRKRKRHIASDLAAVSSLGIIGFIAQVLVWTIVVLLTLDNLGVNITALVAGLGIGGVAVALALQNILGDLLASLSITLDRPFVLGDFLIVDDVLGSVEHIGVKTTRLRSLGGEQIVMSNSDLLKSRMRNYGRMLERRVVFSFGIVYGTPADTIESISPLIRSIIEAHQSTRFDRCHFAKYGASSLDFEVVYYVLSSDYNRYMDIQQSINLRIYREFESRGVEFAYPTQTLHIARRARDGHESA